MHTLDATPLPVGPVDEVPQQCEPENVRELVLQEGPPLGPIDVDHLQDGRHGAEPASGLSGLERAPAASGQARHHGSLRQLDE